MQFAPELGLWSPLIFWYCLVNALLSLGFTVVVIVGGSRDLRFLLRALKEEAAAIPALEGPNEAAAPGGTLVVNGKRSIEAVPPSLD